MKKIKTVKTLDSFGEYINSGAFSMLYIPSKEINPEQDSFLIVSREEKKGYFLNKLYERSKILGTYLVEEQEEYKELYLTLVPKLDKGFYKISSDINKGLIYVNDFFDEESFYSNHNWNFNGNHPADIFHQYFIENEIPFDDIALSLKDAIQEAFDALSSMDVVAEVQMDLYAEQFCLDGDRFICVDPVMFLN